MKLETLIVPRADGAVVVELDGASYKFESINGQLVAEVENEGHLKQLLALSDSFCPADIVDFDAAQRLMNGDNAPEGGEGGEGGEGDENSVPIEMPAKKRASRKPAPTSGD